MLQTGETEVFFPVWSKHLTCYTCFGKHCATVDSINNESMAYDGKHSIIVNKWLWNCNITVIIWKNEKAD